jgi:glycosyltransferase involved in cell wall biosynthesis
MSIGILYVFGGEKAQGAEIVIERLMCYNEANVTAHLFIAPGNFAYNILNNAKPYRVNIIDYLKKLNRSDGNSLKYYSRAFKNYISLPFKIYKYIKANNIDVIHANTIVSASYIVPLVIYSKLFLRSKKWLWSDHDISYYSGLDHYLSKICVRLYDYTLVVSNAVKQKYKSNKKIKILYNGLDYEAFKPDWEARNSFRKKLDIGNDIVIIGMPAVVHPRKGQLELISVFNAMCEKFDNIRLFFAGGYEGATPGYSEQVKAAIYSNEKIIHIGYVNSMSEYYNGCDIIVNNSDLVGSEPLGTSIYEAMACEKIVIASLTGGTPEIITDKKDGFLFEPENQDDLADKLTYAIEHRNNLTALKQAARDKVKAKFSIGNMIEEYNKLLTL